MYPTKFFSSRFTLALAASLTLAPGGCSSGPRSDDPSSFLALAGASATHPQVSLFTASTRRDGRHSGSDAHYASASISIPPNHRAGVIERATFSNSAARNFVVASHRDIGEREFLEEIAERTSSGEGPARDVLVYVHGYDITLDEARFRAAQIVADSGFAGVPVLFTWDSLSRSGLAAYQSDKESATVARDALETLLVDLSRLRSAGRVHVLAHSMGAWLAMESLRAVAISGHPDLDGRLGEVMLAAPDIDLSVFSQQLARVGPEHVTVFVSSTDRVLSISSRVAGDRPRLGALDPNSPGDRDALARLGVAVRDVSRLNSDFMGHNTFAEVPAVVRQIGAQLAASAHDEAERVSVEPQNADAEP